MSKLSGLELRRARLVPSSVFASPDAVVQAENLTRTQKVAILRRWEFDARRTWKSGSDGAVHEHRILDQIRRALASLEPTLPGRTPAPTTRH